MLNVSNNSLNLPHLKIRSTNVKWILRTFYFYCGITLDYVKQKKRKHP